MDGISQNLLEARKALISLERVKDVGAFFPDPDKAEDGYVRLPCTLILKVPARSLFPSKVRAEIRIQQPYPLHNVDVFPDERIRGYHHQDRISRRLCPPRKHERDLSQDRLVSTVRSAINLLEAMAHGSHVTAGEPYDLPDFISHGPQSILPQPVYFTFPASDLSLWSPHFRQFGTVTFHTARSMRGCFADTFIERDNNSVIAPPKWGKHIADEGGPKAGRSGIWVMLPEECCYERHRPPETWGEFASLMERCGINVQGLVDFAAGLDDCRRGPFFLLVGFPIPRMEDSPAVEVHWQPLFVDLLGTGQLERGFPSGTKWTLQIGRTCSAPLAWLRSMNVAKSRMVSRGGLSERLQEAKVLLVGCGSLGSHAAEYLVRGGVGSAALVDHEALHMGNLCRHTGDMPDTEGAKSGQLAKSLNRVRPDVRCEARTYQLPPWGAHAAQFDNIIRWADVILDFTANEAATRFLNDRASQHRKPLYVCWVSFAARFCCVHSNGNEVSALEVADRLMLAADANDECRKLFEKQPDDKWVLEGPGCWHPTFPARDFEMAQWAAFAIAQIDQHFASRTGAPLSVVARQGEDAERGTVRIVQRG